MTARPSIAARQRRRERADRERLTLGLIFGLLSLTAVAGLSRLDRAPPPPPRTPKRRPTPKRAMRGRRTRRIERPSFDATVASQAALVARFKLMRREVEHEMLVALGFEVRVELVNEQPPGHPTVLGWVEDEQVSIFPVHLREMRASKFDPAKLLDMVLIHEAAHVWIRRCHPEYRDGFPTEALVAASEGHAQYVARRVCARLGISETFERFISKELNATNVELLRKSYDAETVAWLLEQSEAWTDRYVRGERFFRRVVEELGYYKAVYTVFKTDPPQVIGEIRNPLRYVRRLKARPSGRAAPARGDRRP